MHAIFDRVPGVEFEEGVSPLLIRIKGERSSPSLSMGGWLSHRMIIALDTRSV